MNTSVSLRGQWIGSYSGTNTGDLVIDIDELSDMFSGTAYAYDNTGLTDFVAQITINPKTNGGQFTLPLQPVNPVTRNPDKWDNVARMFPPNIVVPKTADVTLNLRSDDLLEVSFETDIQTNGRAALPRSQADRESELSSLPGMNNWSDFQRFVSKLEPFTTIYRGQREQKRLRTAFHRTGRSDTARFLRVDIYRYLHRTLRTQHVFDLGKPDELGAFVNLAQHHGYPTPLLDWTYSPYVAAFFAYRRIKNSEAALFPGRKVRIFAFDYRRWSTLLQIARLEGATRPHLSILQCVPIENDRVVAQQAVTTVTNIDDIESYIQHVQTLRFGGEKILVAIDLPWGLRREVMAQLALMGITAGSLFPGIDGTCEALRERLFDE